MQHISHMDSLGWIKYVIHYTQKIERNLVVQKNKILPLRILLTYTKTQGGRTHSLARLVEFT